GTLTVVAPGAKVTVEGTVAVAGVLELRLMAMPPAGAAVDRVNVRFCALNPLMVSVPGVKFTVAFTCTDTELAVKPGAVALMVAVPSLTPVICGCVVGVVWPARIVKVVGEIVRVLVSVLDNVTVTFPTAACGSVTA